MALASLRIAKRTENVQILMSALLNCSRANTEVVAFATTCLL